MSIDTTVLDTSVAVAPDLAWSLDGDDAVLDFPADWPEPDAELAPEERYSWGEVWRNAVLLIVVAAALAMLAAALVSVMLENHESVAAAPPPPAPAVQDPSHDPVVCMYIAAGHTVQQAVKSAQQNSSLTLEQARAYVAAGIAAYCPARAGSA